MPRSRKRRHDERDYHELKKKLKKLVKNRLSRSRSRHRRRRGSTSSSQESIRERDRSDSVRSERGRHLRHRSMRRERSPYDSGREYNRSRSRYSSRDRRSPYIQPSPYPSETEDVIDAVPKPSTSATIGANLEISGDVPIIHIDDGGEEATATTAASAAAPSDVPVVLASTSTDIVAETGNAEMELDSAILEIFGEDPTQTNTFGNEIQKDLAIRLEHTAINGLQRDTKKELKEKYLIPSNCKLIDAPALNPEIKVAVSDMVYKRDKAIETKQKQVACAIACLSQAITRAVSAKEKDTELIKLLMNAGQLLCDNQYGDSITRRSFILTSVKKDMKGQLENTKPDSFLFGQNLGDTLKTAKAINKSGAELKVPVGPKSVVTKKQPPGPGPSKALNSRGPPARRPAGPPRTKEPAPQRSQPTRYPKQLQHRQQHYRR